MNEKPVGHSALARDRKPVILLVANYDSSVGYAWWLMESFWAAIAQHYQHAYSIVLAYPKISNLSVAISTAPVDVVEENFRRSGLRDVFRQCRWLRGHGVQAIYLSDLPISHWRYGLFRIAGVKHIIVHDHTPGVRTPPAGVRRVLKQVYRRIPWISVDLAIGATEFVRERLLKVSLLAEERCAAAPNGIPPDDPVGTQPTDLAATFSITPDRKVMVMCARAHRYKRVDFVIRAMASLVRTGRRDLQFLFIGDGEHLPALRKLAADEGVEEFCTFAGHRSDVAGILASCDFAIHPSSGEVGFSLSILEYMRAGLPVIVPDNPSVCLATEHGRTGLIYREGDRDAAVRAMQRLMDDPEARSRMAATARETVRTRFSLDGTHNALLEALGRLIRPASSTTLPIP